MNWSFSTSRLFSQCPRKWYYQKVYANPEGKNDKQREAYFLSQLSNIRAWRGKVVDQVISRFLIPALNRHQPVNQDALLNFAQKVVDGQLDFGKRKAYRRNTTSEFRNDINYCAFFELEYGLPFNDENIAQCQAEINQSLINIHQSKFLKQSYEDGVHFIAQRTLKLPFSDSLVCCTPDLIAFFKSKPPLVIDWKVETPRYKDHWLQLGLYGVALSRIEPHKDFPTEFHSYLKDPCNIELQEHQLLHNQVHKYKITPQDIVDVENYVYSSSSRMLRLVDNGFNSNPLEIPSAKRAESCMGCNFKKICWRAT